MKTSTAEAWHARYRQQAGWTESLRAYLWQETGLRQARRILEVGSGTGAVLASMAAFPQDHAIRFFGLDLNREYLAFSQRSAPRIPLAQGDAFRLPYASAAFDAVYCHFLLLWLARPADALIEMARVTRPGGVVLALAEPDYGGRIDYPPELAVLGDLQSQSLRRQGANPEAGRMLRHWLTSAGLSDVHSGVLGAQWASRSSQEERELEWDVLQSDMRALLDAGELERVRDSYLRAWAQGTGVLFVPTFYAWGKVP